jgi:hypothetical protein
LAVVLPFDFGSFHCISKEVDEVGHLARIHWWNIGMALIVL